MTRTYEVEIKVPVKEPSVIVNKILSTGGKELNTEVQTDIYFAHPCRSFEETDEALRVRSRGEITEGHLTDHRSLVEMTYKGPKVDSTTKTREEYSIGLNESHSVIQILKRLGFEEVATVVKRRTFFKIDNITISLDNVGAVGTFVELEAIASGESEMTAKREIIIDLVRKLGLDPTDSVRESYLELFLALKK